MVDLGIRWTIGDVSDLGFEALRLSIHGALRAFGSQAIYAVYVNSISIDQAKTRTGSVPEVVQWRPAPRHLTPILRAYTSEGMAEGVAWKFAPLYAFPGRHELALDNDVIIWEAPPSIGQWLNGERDARLIAEDVSIGHGAFADLCGPEPRNSGIRGTAPGFDLAQAIAHVLSHCPVHMTSELDEQGLQVAALSIGRQPLVVRSNEVTICSPFWPHQPQLGTCGAHFVGLNSKQIPWLYYGRPAIEVRCDHWKQHRAELYDRVGLSKTIFSP
jgi:hypothetical protein